MEVVIRGSYMAPILHSLRPRSEKIISKYGGGEREHVGDGEAVLERV